MRLGELECRAVIIGIVLSLFLLGAIHADNVRWKAECVSLEKELFGARRELLEKMDIDEFIIIEPNEKIRRVTLDELFCGTAE